MGVYPSAKFCHLAFVCERRHHQPRVGGHLDKILDWWHCWAATLPLKLPDSGHKSAAALALLIISFVPYCVTCSQKRPKWHSSETHSKISHFRNTLGPASMAGPFYCRSLWHYFTPLSLALVSQFPWNPPPHQPAHPSSFLRELSDTWEEWQGSDQCNRHSSFPRSHNVAPIQHSFISSFVHQALVKHPGIKYQGPKCLILEYNCKSKCSLPSVSL